ncbi:hypothetical protein GCM10027343_21770 [Noviherbaspirillum agri]
MQLCVKQTALLRCPSLGRDVEQQIRRLHKNDAKQVLDTSQSMTVQLQPYTSGMLHLTAFPIRFDDTAKQGQDDSNQ